MNFDVRIKTLKQRMLKCSSVYEKHIEVVNSFLEYYERESTLTHGQQDYLKSIEERYSQASIDEEKKWQDSFDGQKRLNAYRMAQYYSPTMYFTRTVAKVFDNPDDVVLTKKEYQSMCENKYAKKVLGQYSSIPLYKVGQLVEFRKNNKLHIASTRASDQLPLVAAVIEIDAMPIVRAAKGARIYKVLPVGGRPLFAHESDLKRMRKKFLETG